MEKKIFVVNVRWFDGYLETFEAHEVRFGSDLIYLVLTDGTNRHIPTRQVRAWDCNPPTKFSYKEWGTIKLQLTEWDKSFHKTEKEYESAKEVKGKKAK